MNKNTNKINTRKITGVAMFSALAFVVVAVCQFIPKVVFLTPDAKDAVIVIASFIYGPLVAPVISFAVAFLEFITFSSTGPWGLLMNFISSSAFSLTASLLYKYKKNLSFAIIGLTLSVVLTTAVMIPLDILIVPLFAPAISVEAVIALIPNLLLPFNFAKTLLNSAVALLLYKPIINAMRSAGLLPGTKFKTEFNKSTAISLSVGALGLIGAFVILFILW